MSHPMRYGNLSVRVTGLPVALQAERDYSATKPFGRPQANASQTRRP